MAAILAADVVGYSRHIRANEEAALEAWNTLRGEIVEPVIAARRGRIFKLVGDGVLAEFSSAVEAVRTAAEIQRAIAERNAAEGEAIRLELRIGINLGDVIVDGDDLQGDGVNLAARLEGVAEPGGICISASVFEQVRDRVELSFEDLGDRQVKNIDRPVHAWRWASETLSTPDPSSILQERPAIAVLPFENMSGDPDQGYFADGMAEEIITG
ncbi:MAG: adenylate/guanylate cyclase domain-containing protein, partial [Geminicoccaceae bacterium]